MPRKNTTLTHGLCLTILVLVLGAPALAQDWPQWRGPNRDGVAPSFTAPDSWPEELERRWQVEVGTGHSSPVTAGDVVYLHSRESDQEVVRALALADGKTLWHHRYPAPYQTNRAADAHGKGPKSTPVLWQGKLYTLGINGVLSCYEAKTGKLRWQKEFAGEFRTTAPTYGTAASPIVDQGLLIADVGGTAGGELRAFDAESGEVRWGLEVDEPGYASAIVAELGGKRQVITQTGGRIVGVEAATGSLLWSVPYQVTYGMNIVTPVLYGDRLVFSAVRKSTVLYELRHEEGKWSAHEVWKNDKVPMFMSTPVVVGDRLFGMSHQQKGQIVALNAANGEILWASAGKVGENAAIVVAGKLLFILTDRATLIVLSAEAESFAPLARYKVADSPTWAHPVLTGEGILFKDRTRLALWSLGSEAPAGEAGP